VGGNALSSTVGFYSNAGGVAALKIEAFGALSAIVPPRRGDPPQYIAVRFLRYCLWRSCCAGADRGTPIMLMTAPHAGSGGPQATAIQLYT